MHSPISWLFPQGERFFKNKNKEARAGDVFSPSPPLGDIIDTNLRQGSLSYYTDIIRGTRNSWVCCFKQSLFFEKCRRSRLENQIEEKEE
jgi:hypothetical protein